MCRVTAGVVARACGPLVAEEGILAISCCSHKVPEEAFADEVRRGLRDAGRGGRLLRRAGRDVDVLSYLMYPQVYLDYAKKLAQYDNVGVIPTPAFLYGMQPGEEISVSSSTVIVAVSPAMSAR